MKATKEYYLRFRNLFIQMGLNIEVQRLDIYFNLVKVFDKNGNLILIK